MVCRDSVLKIMASLCTSPRIKVHQTLIKVLRNQNGSWNLYSDTVTLILSKGLRPPTCTLSGVLRKAARMIKGEERRTPLKKKSREREAAGGEGMQIDQLGFPGEPGEGGEELGCREWRKSGVLIGRNQVEGTGWKRTVQTEAVAENVTAGEAQELLPADLPHLAWRSSSHFCSCGRSVLFWVLLLCRKRMEDSLSVSALVFLLPARPEFPPTSSGDAAEEMADPGGASRWL